MNGNAIKIKDEVWALIPARGSSKSIPLKNLAVLNGRPLIDYVIKAAKASRFISRIICSTENAEIAAFCTKNDIEVQKRPHELAQDDIPTLDVIVYFLEKLIKEEGAVANIIVLLESTSPFVLSEHIDKCVELLKEHPEMDSAQTITPISPNNHAYNQRYLSNNFVKFQFAKERDIYYNKQLKPKLYVHGNVRVLRSNSLLKKRGLFGDYSLPHIIPRNYAMDVDGPEDLKLAECLLNCGLVKLP